MPKTTIRRLEIKRLTPPSSPSPAKWQIAGGVNSSLAVTSEKEATIDIRLHFTYFVEGALKAIFEVEGDIRVSDFHTPLVPGGELHEQPPQFTSYVERAVTEELIGPAMSVLRAAKLPSPLPALEFIPRDSPEPTLDALPVKTP